MRKAEQWQEKIDGLNKGNYQFQARFALLAQHMDNFVEWFCKSGEDRTGLLNEHIEAYCIFIEQNGHAPRWGNEEDNKKFHKMMPHVHNGAPNRETNGFNDDSPGLKVSDADFEMRNLSYYTDKKMANMAADSSKIKGVMNVEKIKKIIKGEPENVNPPIVSTFNHNKLLTQVNKTQQPTPDNPSTPKKLKPKS